MSKNYFSDREKTFEIRGERIWKNFEITRTIYSNGERSEQFLVTECFFNLFLEGFSDLINYNSNWKKMLGFRNMQEKLKSKAAKR